MLNLTQLPKNWQPIVGDEFNKPYFTKLKDFVDSERETAEVFPPEDEVFNAFKSTPYEKVKVLLLGQDPYYRPGQAHGLCFSVKAGVPIPPSLRNMYKELADDIGCKIPKHGCLVAWAKQGILMLNAVLTVRANEPNSHKNKGWEKFTDAVISILSALDKPIVFVLWGSYAQKKRKLIDASSNTIIEGVHPSPLSAKAGFFGSRPYSAINRHLQALGYEPINWQLPEQATE